MTDEQFRTGLLKQVTRLADAFEKIAEAIPKEEDDKPRRPVAHQARAPHRDTGRPG